MQLRFSLQSSYECLDVIKSAHWCTEYCGAWCPCFEKPHRPDWSFRALLQQEPGVNDYTNALVLLGGAPLYAFPRGLSTGFKEGGAATQSG